MSDAKHLARIGWLEQLGERIAIESAAGVDRHGSRLIDDQDHFVFIDNPDVSRDLRFDGTRHRVNEVLPGLHSVALANPATIERNRSIGNPSFPITDERRRMELMQELQKRQAIHGLTNPHHTAIVIRLATGKRVQVDRALKPIYDGSPKDRILRAS